MELWDDRGSRHARTWALASLDKVVGEYVGQDMTKVESQRNRSVSEAVGLDSVCLTA